MDPARPPLKRLVLTAASVADDVGFVALHDLGRVMAGDSYRIIGGHMVLNGDQLDVEVSVADEVSALVLKAHATTVRSKATDVVDIWRCLEVCFAAGSDPAQFTGSERVGAVTRVRELFGSRSGDGMTSLIDEQRLTPRAADERYTRIRALVDRIVAWK